MAKYGHRLSIQGTGLCPPGDSYVVLLDGFPLKVRSLQLRMDVGKATMVQLDIFVEDLDIGADVFTETL